MKKRIPGNALFRLLCTAWLIAGCLIACRQPGNAGQQDVAIIPGEGSPPVVKVAAQVLAEEVGKRTGLQWETASGAEEHLNMIYLSVEDSSSGNRIPPEGFRLTIEPKGQGTVIRITGADGRGVLFGVGKLLRLLEWRKGGITFPAPMELTTAPAYPLRGHQLGYRETANSYDAWTPEIYDQHIRELALFGTNAIENIPMHPGKPILMKVDPFTMNTRMSQICEKYDLDFWVWTPAEFDLADPVRRQEALARHKAMYEACPRLDGIFFPGGDPGDNHPRLIMPFLEELSHLLQSTHPKAKLWLSMQSFDEEEIDYVYAYLEKVQPDWFGGLVHGPGSPPLASTRERLPARYMVRHYPDITHSCRSQYPVSWWDPALARTEGRECPNPQPLYYALIHNAFARFTNGFITYSDGMHDDLVKVIWNAKGWDPQADEREVLKEYARFFFRPDLADSVADGILALESNWVGALAQNGSVETTLQSWQSLEKRAPELRENWRWQLFLLRSRYDAYIRRRLLHERELEKKANLQLAEAPRVGADTATNRALRILETAVSRPVSPELRNEIESSAEILYKVIGFQTSVKKYQAKSLNRGAIIDYLDLPMNNRLWLEDELAKIRTLPEEQEKLARLKVICEWENPGEGSFYDDIGTLDRSVHLVHGESLATDPLMERNTNPGYWYWDEGFNRLRLSWLVSIDHPVAMVYENLDKTAVYDVRVTGYRVDQLQMNGEWIRPFVFSNEKGAVVEYHVPLHAVKSGRLTLNWGDPEITEVWLIKKQQKVRDQ